jgi:hypothetical protein
MVAASPITAKANKPNPTLAHRELVVPLVDIVNPANPESCHKKSRVLLPNVLPRFSQSTNMNLNAAELEHTPYKNIRAEKYAKHKMSVFERVVLASRSSALMRKAMHTPPRSIAKPRVKITSLYIPLFQLLTLIFGFGSALERNTTVRLILFVVFLASATIALLLSMHVVVLSTGISQHILSTVNFTLPYVR